MNNKQFKECSDMKHWFMIDKLMSQASKIEIREILGKMQDSIIKQEIRRKLNILHRRKQ